jgi:hypothetical protein
VSDDKVKVDKTGLRLVDLSKACPRCGGLLDAEPFPAHARGCGCAHRKVVHEQKKLAALILAQGSLSPDQMASLSRGDLPVELSRLAKSQDPSPLRIHKNRRRP